ncbi:MAG: RtcB family protein [Planctomycetota bacterium]
MGKKSKKPSSQKQGFKPQKLNLGEVVLQEIEPDIYEIAPFGDMNVPLRIYISEEMLQQVQKDQSLLQGINTTKLPGVQKRALMMPDAHQGYGFPIGGVAAFDAETGVISPGGIGYDINCGVRLLASNMSKPEIQDKMDALMESLYNNVHTGVGSKSSIRLSESDLDEVLMQGLEWAKMKGYANSHDLAHVEENGKMSFADPSKVSKKAKERGKEQVGTLGAGNHFLEVQVVDQIFDEKTAKVFGITHVGQVCVMIHSGSRGLGHQVCTDFLRRMEDEQPEIVESLPERELIYAPIKSQLAQDYIKAMHSAANFGFCNRQLMVHFTRKAFTEVLGDQIELKTVYDVVHNMAKLERHQINGKEKEVWVHRKGATRAFGPGHLEIPEDYRAFGQPVLIPGSMGTASYILAGTQKAMDETFGSTPHGAGRQMSRHAANQKWRGEKVRNELAHQGITIKSKSWKGVSEEAPGAYKDVDEVVAVANKVGFGKIVARLKPVGVLKG